MSKCACDLSFGPVSTEKGSMLFFPLRDENRARRAPLLNYALISANVLVFLWMGFRELSGQFWLSPWLGLVPTRFLADPAGEAGTLFSSMFMHAGWLHLASNMWFLHIFGDNLEDVLGRTRYLLFYGACGVFAGLAQISSDTGSSIPMVGASGAIAGVVGGYVVLYPRAPILAFNTVPLLWLFLGLVVILPAWVIALLFFGQNLLLAWTFAESAGGPGVAFFAHLGGFVAGLALIRPMLGHREHTPRAWDGLRRRSVKGARRR